MGKLRSRAARGHEQAAWEGPFGPPPSIGHPRFNPMVRTAAELVTGTAVELEHKESEAAHAA